MTCDMMICAAKVPRSGVVNMPNAVSPYTTSRTREEERRKKGRERLAMPRHPLHDLYTGNAALTPHGTPFPSLSSLVMSRDDECHLATARPMHNIRRISTRASRIDANADASPVAGDDNRRYCSRAGNACGYQKRSWETVTASFRSLRL